MDPFDLHILVDAARDRIGLLVHDMVELIEQHDALTAVSWRDMADWSGELAGITRAIADAADRGELL